MTKKNKISNIKHISLLPFISILLIIIFVALLNIPVMVTLWRYSFDDGTYSHAYIIPLIVGYLYYLQYKDNKLVFRENFSWPALIIFLLSSYILFITTTAQISLAYWLATLLLLSSTINLFFVTSIKVIFPSLYFIFLLPVWGGLVPFLQSLSVHAVNAIMSLTPIPVFVEHQFVHIPEGVFEIAGGCSGLRYLITSLAISSLFVFLYLRTFKSTILFGTFAILGALLTNWLRIVILIIIGHRTNMTSSLMTDHNMFGWYLYIPFMFLLFKWGNTLITNIDDKSELNTSKANLSTIPLPLSLAPNFKLIIISAIVSVIVLSLSSTTLKSLLFSSDQTKPLTSDIKFPVHPTVYHYSSVEKVILNAQTTRLTYDFNGSNLEEKPTFFNNNLIPKGWKLITIQKNKQWQKLYVKKGDQQSVISISYEIGNIKIPTVNKFKIERLKQALLGQHNTKLYWQFHFCTLANCNNV